MASAPGCSWSATCSPDTASGEDLRLFQLHLVEQGVSSSSLNVIITSLKFFFEVTLNHAELMAKMHPVPVPRKLPKRPFAGPKAVLAYLSRYTHRGAISNRRLVAIDERGITFRWKDYRSKSTMHKTMTLGVNEFMRRFLLHVLPSGFHRIRHYGLLANAGRRANLAKARTLLNLAPATHVPATLADPLVNRAQSTFVCPHCGTPMIITAFLPPNHSIRAPPRHQGAPP